MCSGAKAEKYDKSKRNWRENKARKKTAGKRHICENEKQQASNNNYNHYIIIHTNSNGDNC